MEDIHMISVYLIFAINFSKREKSDSFASSHFFFYFWLIQIVIPHHCSVRAEDICVIDKVCVGVRTSYMVRSEVIQIKTHIGRHYLRRFYSIKIFKIRLGNNSLHYFMKWGRWCARKVRHSHITLHAKGFGVCASFEFC